MDEFERAAIHDEGYDPQMIAALERLRVDAVELWSCISGE
jgi:hypothetical protein